MCFSHSRDIQIVILAAGQGKRMNNDDLPKVLVPLKGKPLIQRLLEAIKESGVGSRPVIVVGYKADLVKQALGSNYEYVLQAEQLGTGHAVACTKSELAGQAKNIMVLYGDMPFITAETIKKIAQTHSQEKKVLTMATAIVEDFNDWRQGFYSFGRVIRDADNKVIGIVERKDATPEALAVREINPAYFCFQAKWLWRHLDKLKNKNAQAEYYLTDLADLAFKENKEIAVVKINPREAIGINTAAELEGLEKMMFNP